VTRLRLEMLQWYAVFAGPWAWAAQHVLLFGVANAHCSESVTSWNVPVIWLNVAITVVFGAAVVAAEVAAYVVFRETSKVDENAPGLHGRLRFFAQAALLGNVLFLMIVALDATGALYHGCGQA
jgi:hypothetical protein